MTIHLPEHLERYVHDQVQAGLYPTEDEVIRDALERHRQAQHPPAKATGQSDLTPEEIADQELQRRLLEAGIVSEIKPPSPTHARPEPSRRSPSGRADFRNHHPRASLTVAAYFLDTSTVVKRYVLETGTAWVQALADPSARHSCSSRGLRRGETVAAITRRARGSRSPRPGCRGPLAAFPTGFCPQYRIVEVTIRRLVAQAATLPTGTPYGL